MSWSPCRDASRSPQSQQVRISRWRRNRPRAITPKSSRWPTSKISRNCASDCEPLAWIRFRNFYLGGRDGPCGTDPAAEIVVSAAVGVVGLPATYAAVKLGKTIALANKEVLVAAGELVTQAARQKNVALLPVDSEHNAIHQCLRAGQRAEVKRLVLTASGGPFRKTPAIKLAP